MLLLEKQQVWRGSSCCYILSFLYYRYGVWIQSMAMPNSYPSWALQNMWSFLCTQVMSNWTDILYMLHLKPWYSMFAGFWGVCWSFASSDSFARTCLWMAGKHYSIVITIGSWMSDRIIFPSCPRSNLLLFKIYCLAQYSKKYKNFKVVMEW